MNSIGGTVIGVFWASGDGRVVIFRHCDSVFELIVDGEQAMPINRYEPIANYVMAEFPPDGFQ